MLVIEMRSVKCTSSKDKRWVAGANYQAQAGSSGDGFMSVATVSHGHWTIQPRGDIYVYEDLNGVQAEFELTDRAHRLQ